MEPPSSLQPQGGFPLSDRPEWRDSDLVSGRDLALGDVIGNTYRIRQRLGAGGMGIVYLAHDDQLDRPVAVKLLHARFASTFFVDSLQSEARAMARIKHDNVVGVHAFGRHGDAPYLAMEFVPGPDLGRWLNWNDGLDIDQALSVLEQVAAGLEAIHEAGIVHHDVKPENILVGPNLRVAITDLGLARIVSTSNMSDWGGTPVYMAPEKLRGEPLTAEMAKQTDLWALAVLAYELLTDELPFDGVTREDILTTQLVDGMIPPSAVRPELGTAFDDLLSSALSLQAEERPRSATAFAKSLLAARNSVPKSRPGGIHVVVADDDNVFRSIAAAALQSHFENARITEVSDGRRALEVLDREGADVALIDLNMPCLNGLELTAVIRSSEALRSTRIVVATAVGGATDWRVLSSLGVDALMLKPVRVPDLVQTFERLLGV